MKKLSAEISVFFALVTAMILALFLGILESARTQAARLNMTIAVNSAMDSLFSQYHRTLWDDYRLLGLEHYTYGQLTDEMADFLKPYIEVKNWYPAELNGIEFDSAIPLTFDNGEIFEEDMLDYMKYGIVAEIWDMAKINLYDEGEEEGTALDEISDLYDGHAVEAADLERIIGEIANCVKKAENDVGLAKSALNSGSPDGEDFIDNVQDAIKELEKLPNLVKKYEKAADKLKDELEESRRKLESKNEEVSDEVWEALNDDIDKYESYVLEEGEKRSRIKALEDEAKDYILFLKDRIEQAKEIMEEIENYEPPEGEEEGDESSYEEFLRQVWQPLIDEMNGHEGLKTDLESGIKDEEKQNKLEKLKKMFEAPDLLSLVLSKDDMPSTKELELDEVATNISLWKGKNESRFNIPDSVYMAFYVGAFFNYFGREDKKGLGGCEQEYILYGETNDHDNLKATVTRLVAIRTGLNLAYLYKDSGKRTEADALATMIGGVPPLSTIIKFLILSVWAMGQAVIDVRELLSGGKVPFIHDSESFSLTLTGLLNIADSESIGDEGSKKNEDGLSYADYLKILIFVGHDSDMDYRTMDMIELALRSGQADFKMDKLTYSAEATVNFTMAHLFTELGFTQDFGFVDKNYDLSISTSYSY